MPTGLDSAELISQLRAAHAADSATASGVDVITGGVGDMGKLGIYESFRVRPQGRSLMARGHMWPQCVVLWSKCHVLHMPTKICFAIA